MVLPQPAPGARTRGAALVADATRERPAALHVDKAPPRARPQPRGLGPYARGEVRGMGSPFGSKRPAVCLEKMFTSSTNK